MRYFFSAAIAALACGTAAVVTAIEADASPSLRSKDGKPIGKRGLTVVDYNSQELTEIADQVPSDIASMDPTERAELIGTLAEKMQESLEELEEYDLSEFPALLEAVKAARDAVHGVMKPMAESISLIEAAGEQQQQHHEAVADGEEKDKALAQKHKHRRAKETKTESGDGKTGGSKKEEEYGEHDWRHHYHGHRHKYSNHHKSSGRHKHANDIQEAILNGDHAFLNNMVGSMHASTASRFSSSSRRRAAEQDEEQLHRDLQTDKATNCEQLTKCALKMSLYDLFVYFFSDDINPTTGEIDDSVVGYDEMDGDTVNFKSGIKKKHDAILAAAQALKNSGNYNSAQCDDLLKLFHRSIEVNGNPEWEGAFVAQVCFAEGTQAFVHLKHISLALAEQVPAPTLTTLLAYLTNLGQVLDPFLIEILDCAQGIFNEVKKKIPSSEPRSREPFPFYTVGKTELAFPDSVNFDEDARDVHGRLKDLSKPAFKTTPYVDMKISFAECFDYSPNKDCKLKDEMKDEDIEKYVDCVDENSGLKIDKEECTDALSCFGAVFKAMLLKCLPELATKIQEGIELVFGEGTSTGFICGLNEGLKDGKNLPGDCCLNAPFELSGDAWGFEYNCHDQARNPCMKGPIFSGISEEACSVYGGTFCPTPDCAELRDCVDSEIKYANNHELPMYLQYLTSSPQIGDKTDDQFACGRAREYFGYEPNFIDDSGICDDIKQLRYSDDFDFLNEFFNQGDKGTVTKGGGTCDAKGESKDGAVACVPNVGLAEPSRAVSGVPPPTNGQIWRGANFALAKAAEVIEFIRATVYAVKCPCDPFCISNNICAGIKTAILLPMAIIAFVIGTAADISEFTMGELAEVGNIEPIETWENTGAVFPNMELMGDWMQARMKYLYQETTCRKVEQLLPGHGCDGQVNLCDGNKRVPDTCDEDRFDPVIDFSGVDELCASGRYVFPSVEAAQLCVEYHVEASDDCQATDVTVSNPGVGSQDGNTCGTVEKIQVMAKEAEPCQRSTTETYHVLVDKHAKAYCKFTHSPEVPPELDLTEAIEQCSEKYFFPTISDAIACVKQYAMASDDCREVDVTVTSPSNKPIVETCGSLEHEVQIKANIRGCSLSTTKTMHVFVDPNVHKPFDERSNPSCQFFQGPRFDPILDVSQAIELCNGEIFPTITAAEACVLRYTVAKDSSSSCRPVPLTVNTVNVNGYCEHEVTITANIQGCMPLETVSVPINVTIDNEPPVPSCEFLLEDSFWEKEKDDDDLLNPLLKYTATENCRTPLQVTIDGFSNELDQHEHNKHDKQRMLLIYEEPRFFDDESTANTKMGWYIENEVCYHKGHKDEHKLKDGKCIHDPSTPWTRFYKARITARDEAGLVASSECLFEIYEPPSKSKQVRVEGPPSQFFSLASYNWGKYIPDNKDAPTD